MSYATIVAAIKFTMSFPNNKLGNNIIYLTATLLTITIITIQTVHLF